MKRILIMNEAEDLCKSIGSFISKRFEVDIKYETQFATIVDTTRNFKPDIVLFGMLIKDECQRDIVDQMVLSLKEPPQLIVWGEESLQNEFPFSKYFGQGIDFQDLKNALIQFKISKKEITNDERDSFSKWVLGFVPVWFELMYYVLFIGATLYFYLKKQSFLLGSIIAISYGCLYFFLTFKFYDKLFSGLRLGKPGENKLFVNSIYAFFFLLLIAWVIYSTVVQLIATT